MASSKGAPFRSYEDQGFEILVGKGAKENDRLTFRVAKGGDFWLHASGYAGSHVVIVNPDGLDAPPREVLEHAAQLAAFHSKAREARGKIDVHWCRAADVRKPRGFPPGMVQLKDHQIVKVYVRDPFA